MSGNYVDITPIRKSPNRINNPETFKLDSNLFLVSLPQYRNQINRNVDYYNNNVNFNKTDYGKITGKTEIPPNYSVMKSTTPVQNGESTLFTSNVDKFYKEMVDRGDLENVIGKWIEKIDKSRSQILMEGKPVVSKINVPMTSNQGKELFNTTANNFSVSVKSYSQSMFEYYSFIKGIIKNEDFGKITDTSSATLDAGELTDIVVN